MLIRKYQIGIHMRKKVYVLHQTCVLVHCFFYVVYKAYRSRYLSRCRIIAFFHAYCILQIGRGQR